MGTMSSDILLWVEVGIKNEDFSLCMGSNRNYDDDLICNDLGQAFQLAVQS